MSSIEVTYEITVWSDVFAVVACMILLLMLWRQKWRERTSQSAERNSWLNILIIFPIYEPILWVVGAAFLVQVFILTIPGPYPAVPLWYLGATYASGRSADDQWNAAGLYWAYWFTFEIASEGFGIMLLHKYPSAEAFGSVLRYAVLYAALSSGLTTLAFCKSNLGIADETQLLMDVLFLALPLIMYAGLLITQLFLSGRRSLLLYIIFSICWRCGFMIALYQPTYNSGFTSAVTFFRSFAFPFAIYGTLVLDTQYWKMLPGRAVANLEKLVVDRRKEPFGGRKPLEPGLVAEKSQGAQASKLSLLEDSPTEAKREASRVPKTMSALNKKIDSTDAPADDAQARMLRRHSASAEASRYYVMVMTPQGNMVRREDAAAEEEASQAFRVLPAAPADAASQMSRFWSSFWSFGAPVAAQIANVTKQNASKPESVPLLHDAESGSAGAASNNASIASATGGATTNSSSGLLWMWGKISGSAGSQTPKPVLESELTGAAAPEQEDINPAFTPIRDFVSERDRQKGEAIHGGKTHKVTRSRADLEKVEKFKMANKSTLIDFTKLTVGDRIGRCVTLFFGRQVVLNIFLIF
jgi:hypothetical protein